jgi:hypothetical protein
MLRASPVAARQAVGVAQGAIRAHQAATGFFGQLRDQRPTAQLRGFRVKISRLLGEYSLSFAAHKTGSAVVSREFGHPHEFPGTVFGVEPDNILLRISDERTVGDDPVP